MKKFSEFNLPPVERAFTGDKIKIGRVLNKPITVHGFKIKDSKYNEGKRLDLQISVAGTKHVLFTGSQVMLEQIQKVPASEFPFEATIVEQDEAYLFS